MDLGCMCVAVVPFVILRAVRYIFSWLGINEHTWRGVANNTNITAADRKAIGDAALLLTAGKCQSPWLSESANRPAIDPR